MTQQCKISIETKNWIQIIKKIAEENGYAIDDKKTNGLIKESYFMISMTQWHSEAFQISCGNGQYLEVKKWEESESIEEGRYGRAVYSIQNYTDLIYFCNVIIAGSVLRAKKNK